MALLSKLIKRKGDVSSPVHLPLVIKDKVKNDERYAEWAKNHHWTPRMEQWCRRQIEHLKYRPTIGILMQCASPKEQFLRESLSSVFNQVYPFVELSIVDRGSDPKIRAVLGEVETDPRVKVLYQKGSDRDITLIAKIMKKKAAEYLLFLEAEDILEPTTLFNMVAAMQDAKEVDFVYSDSDLIDEEGLRFEPQFKPQWAVGAHYPLGYYQHPVLLHERVIVKMRGHERVSLYMENGELLDEASNHSKQAVQASGVLYHARRRGSKNEVPPKAESSVLMNENLSKSGSEIVIDSEIRAMSQPNVPLKLLWWIDSLAKEERSEMLFVMARYLAKHTGHKLTVICSSDGPLKKNYQGIATVEIVEPALDRIKQLHRESPFDAAWISTREPNFPDGFAELKLPSVWAPDLQQPGWEALSPASFEKPETIALPTLKTLEQLRQLAPGTTARLLGPCVDLDEIKLYKQKTSPIFLREKFNIEKASTVFTISGPTVPDKGQHSFIDAALMLQKRKPDQAMDFFITGAQEGAYLDLLKQKIEGSDAPQQFHLIEESADRTNDYPYLWISNVVVSCTKGPGYPLGILEGMALKKAVISSKSPGADEVMEENNNGFLLESEDIAALADGTEILMKDIPLQDDYGRRSLEIVMETFHVKKVATRLESLLRESIVM